MRAPTAREVSRRIGYLHELAIDVASLREEFERLGFVDRPEFATLLAAVERRIDEDRALWSELDHAEYLELCR